MEIRKIIDIRFCGSTKTSGSDVWCENIKNQSKYLDFPAGCFHAVSAVVPWRRRSAGRSRPVTQRTGTGRRWPGPGAAGRSSPPPRPAGTELWTAPCGPRCSPTWPPTWRTEPCLQTALEARKMKNLKVWSVRQDDYRSSELSDQRVLRLKVAPNDVTLGKFLEFLDFFKIKFIIKPPSALRNHLTLLNVRRSEEDLQLNINFTAGRLWKHQQKGKTFSIKWLELCQQQVLHIN